MSSFQRIICISVFLCFFFAKTRRTQSMRPIVSQRIGSNSNIQTQRGSMSSISSSGSGSTVPEVKKSVASTSSEPVASTSSRKQIDTTGYKEVELNPLVKTAKKVRIANQNRAIIQEASVGTFSENIIPSRDGFYARIILGMRRHGLPIGAGISLGGGGVEIARQFYNENKPHAFEPVMSTISTPVTTTISAPAWRVISTESDKIIDPI